MLKTIHERWKPLNGSYGVDIPAQRITMGTPIAKFCHSEIDFPSLVRDPAL